jgi:4-carboxymuconolactone decarboxylase
VFGALWTRPGRDPELELHVRMARRQGWTEEELAEVLLHRSGYVGVPLIREALVLTASWVFQEMRHEELLPET